MLFAGVHQMRIRRNVAQHHVILDAVNGFFLLRRQRRIRQKTLSRRNVRKANGMVIGMNVFLHNLNSENFS